MNASFEAPIPRPEAMSVHYDYIKVSYPMDDTNMLVLRNLAQWRAEYLAEQYGERTVEPCSRGFEGSHVKVLVLGNRMIEIVSGIGAYYWARSNLVTLSWRRVDVAVDFFYQPVDDNFEFCERIIQNLYDFYFLRYQTVGKPGTVTLIKSTSGSTLYLNRRVSERFVRIYNKTAEQRLKDVDIGKPILRIEIELKGRGILFTEHLPPSDEYLSAVTSLMAKQYHIPFLGPAEYLRRIKNPDLSRKPWESKLEWIRTRVLNTLRMLAMEAPEELKAMGIRVELPDE